MTGSTSAAAPAASPNKLITNTAGSSGKGNGANGILVVGSGNGSGNPIELDGNTTKGNTLNGIKVTGGGTLATGHQLKNNISGGSGGDDNGDYEFVIGANNVDSGGNKANGVAITFTAAGGNFGTP